VNIQAQNYYVSNGGNNANSGLTPEDPFETIQHAADIVSAGDTVFVEDGNYVGFDIRDVNGTENAPIVFFASGENVLINVSGPLRDDGINVENADHIVIDGFIVNGMPGSGNGVRVVLSDFCVVRNCSCDNNAERGIFTGFTDDILIEYNECSNSVDEHGIYVSNSSDRPVVRYNICHHNNNIGIHMNGDLSAGGDGIISNARIYGNILYENGLAAGVNMDGLEDPEVYNNLIFNNHSAQGIALFQQDGAIPTSGAKIYNNTIIVPSDGRWGILVQQDCNVGTRIFNNIIINQHLWRGCIAIWDTTGFESDFNIVNDKLSDSGDGSTISLAEWQALGLDEHSQLADVLSAIFNDPTGDDFTLLSNSQAVDTGSSIVLGLVDIDLNGILRPYGAAVDIGAYEYTPYCPGCWNGGSVVYIDSAASGMNDGTTWMDAFTDLQNGLEALRYFAAVEEAWVSAGTYFPDTASDRTRSFEFFDSMKVYGGFNGTEADLDQRDPMVNSARLSGDIGGMGGADNSFHVIDVGESCTGCILDGVTISDGNSTGSASTGSGILCRGILSVNDVTLELNAPGSKVVTLQNHGDLRCAGTLILTE